MFKSPLLGMTILFVGLLGLYPAGLLAYDEQQFQSQQDYIQERLGERAKSQVYWLTDTDKQVIEQILAHDFSKVRLRYWSVDTQSVWVLDEIGKEMPITVGIHVQQQKIANLRVLVYRESRGDEVRHGFFTEQFTQATLTDELQLDQHIDGITGATLSVRALNKLARIALYLDTKSTQQVTP
jgi:Na+-translocating ferredoxin:NAD+ oxidoreductase RnfG subunit